MSSCAQKVTDEFSKCHYYGLTILRSVDPALPRLQLEFHPEASESIGLTLFASPSRPCPSLTPFSPAFLLVNSLTNRRHFAVKALTGSPTRWCTRKSVPLGEISIFSSPMRHRKCVHVHLRGPVCCPT